MIIKDPNFQAQMPPKNPLRDHTGQAKQIKNPKFQKKPFRVLGFDIDLTFGFWHWDFRNLSFKKNSGITLLLVVVLLSAILSISVGIFSIMFGQLLISGEVSSSFRALYAADQGIEKLLYLDRLPVGTGLCQTPGPDCYTIVNPVPAESGGCYTAAVSKDDIDSDDILDTIMRVTGEYPAPCAGDLTRAVKRAFEITYPSPQ